MYLSPHIIVRITTEADYHLFCDYPLEHRVNPHSYDASFLPMYVRVNLGKTKAIGYQTDVFNVGAEYIATYNSGISVEEFLGITDVSKPSMEYW